MTVDDLIKACVVMSANDAAVVLAEAVAGSEDAFVERMNARAAELGMNDTVFKNCNGLDEDGHITSAYDVAVMSRALMQHEKIFDYTLIWIDYVRDGQTQLVNTNKLVRTYDGIFGAENRHDKCGGQLHFGCGRAKRYAAHCGSARCGKYERPLFGRVFAARLRFCKLEADDTGAPGTARAARYGRHGERRFA